MAFCISCKAKAESIFEENNTEIYFCEECETFFQYSDLEELVDLDEIMAQSGYWYDQEDGKWRKERSAIEVVS